jgi:hypothetical protein
MIYQATGEYEAARAAYEKERIYSNGADEKNPEWLMITAQVEAVGGKREERCKSLNAAPRRTARENNPLLIRMKSPPRTLVGRKGKRSQMADNRRKIAAH